MRISCTPGDPGYDTYSLLTTKQRPLIRVFLNGNLMADVVTADDLERMVEVFVRDASGSFVLNDARDSVVTERLYGRVDIQLPET